MVKIDNGMLGKGKKYVIPNIQEEAEMLEWAGISFGEEETYKLGKSIKRLAVMSGAGALKFVGKMYGTQKDYWLASGVLIPGEESMVSANCEKRGEGVNKFVFWVTDNLLNDWIQLPDCKPEHIQGSLARSATSCAPNWPVFSLRLPSCPKVWWNTTRKQKK